MNYFNYFTEIEDRFRERRQSGIFLLSPLDWALIEAWKEAGVPLEAALKGIDRAFEKWHKRTRKFQRVNSLAYCAQEVLTAAREMAEGGLKRESERPAGRFDDAELQAFFADNAVTLRESAKRVSEPLTAAMVGAAASLEKLAEAAGAGTLEDLEAIEARLTVLEEKLLAATLQAVGEDDQVEIRLSMQSQLAPYRAKMTADQLAMLEKQYVQREAFARAGVPRLSLFYLK